MGNSPDVDLEVGIDGGDDVEMKRSRTSGKAYCPLMRMRKGTVSLWKRALQAQRQGPWLS